MTDVTCNVRPDTDEHFAEAAYYIEWDEGTLQMAGFACADCTVRLRAGELLTEYSDTPHVVLIRRVDRHLGLVEEAKRRALAAEDP